ncbi:MAG: tetratricopeptide repeat-containing sulfotransferase family protein [Phycisphaerales bacterium]
MPPKKKPNLLEQAKQLETKDDIPGAIKLYRSYLSKNRSHPNAMSVRVRAAQLCVMRGKHDEAIKLIENAGLAGRESLILMYTLAQASAYSGRLDEAHKALERTLEIDPDYPSAIARLATIMQYEGLADDAVKVLDDANKRGIDTWDIDQTFGELAPKSGRIDEAVDRLQKRLADSTLKLTPRITMLNTLASLLEKQEDYKGAWEAADQSNRLNTGEGYGGYALKGIKNNKNSTDLTRFKARIRKVMEIFTVDFLRTFEPTDKGPELRPEILMISGMPRSGTTLLEQILSSHPESESAGEASFLVNAAAELKMYPNPSAQIMERLSINKRNKIGETILQGLQEISGSSRYVVDKHPSNDEHIGLLSAVAPGSKMILTRRDPRDIAMSCFFRNFALGHGWTNKFDAIVDMLEIRLEMHDYWLEVIPEGAPWIDLMVGDYQAIVENPEVESRKLVEFSGMSWDDACLNFSKRKRIVPTLQPHQAAQGVYKGSLAKWVPYSEFMGPSLDRLNAICEKHGYAV